MAIKIILLDIEPEDYILACRAARYQLERTDGGKAAILQYGHTDEQRRDKTFHVKRNKASITVRKC